MTRCYNPNSQNYRFYGGKGVRVCDEWRGTPKVFIAWLEANGWARGLSVDRIDPGGDYRPGNCRVVTMLENIRHMHATTRAKNAAGDLFALTPARPPS